MIVPEFYRLRQALPAQKKDEKKPPTEVEGFRLT